MVAVAALIGGLWLTWRASKKAKEAFAPLFSRTDYLAIFLWVLVVILGAAAILGWGK
jgi:nitrate reductase gamma subunit